MILQWPLFNIINMDIIFYQTLYFDIKLTVCCIVYILLLTSHFVITAKKGILIYRSSAQIVSSINRCAGFINGTAYHLVTCSVYWQKVCNIIRYFYIIITNISIVSIFVIMLYIFSYFFKLFVKFQALETKRTAIQGADCRKEVVQIVAHTFFVP